MDKEECIIFLPFTTDITDLTGRRYNVRPKART